MRSTATSSDPRPRPTQGVGEFGRPRRTWNAEIPGSNPGAPTIPHRHLLYT